MPGLDITNSRPGYLLGRLHCLLGWLEQAATGVDDQIMGRTGKLMEQAPTNPAITLRCWQREAPQWLRKLAAKSPSRAEALSARLAEIATRVQLPDVWTSEEQSLWVVGYHHQRYTDLHATVTTAEVAGIRGLASAESARKWLSRLVAGGAISPLGRSPETGEKLWPRDEIEALPRRGRGRPRKAELQGTIAQS
jgi:hypothetical protein